MNHSAFLAWARQAVTKAGTAKEWAQQHGISPVFLSAVLAGKKPASPAVLDALGVERVVIYRLRGIDPEVGEANTKLFMNRIPLALALAHAGVSAEVWDTWRNGAPPEPESIRALHSAIDSLISEKDHSHGATRRNQADDAARGE